MYFHKTELISAYLRTWYTAMLFNNVYNRLLLICLVFD